MTCEAFKNSKPICQKSGFSLIEIALTIAILAITLVPILGVLSVASREDFKSDTLSIGASIASDLFSQAQQASYEQIERWESDSPDYYFDNEGIRIDDGDKDDALFTARLEVESTQLDGEENEFMKQVTVWVSAFPGDSSDRLDDAIAEVTSNSGKVLPSSIRTYQSLITQLEKPADD